MKIFRLANAELGKLLHRPAIYIMTAFLALALVITAFTFNPQTKSDNLTNFGTPTGSVSEAFAIFNSSTTATDSKHQLETALNSVYQDIQAFSTSESEHQNLLDSAKSVNALLTTGNANSLPEILYAFINSPTTTNRTALNNVLEATNESIRNQALRVYNYCAGLSHLNNIDYYATTFEINEIETVFLNLASAIPVNIETLSNEQIVETSENLRTSFNLSPTISKIEGFKKITIPSETITKITTDYYDNIKYQEGSDTLLTNLFEKIENFAHINGTSTEKADKTELNKLITEYKNATYIAISLMQNSFNLEKAGDYSNAELKKYIGFSNYNLYNINEQITLNQHLLDKEIFHGEYRTNLNFGVSSGAEPSAYDFAFYAVQILGIIIAIFCMFFAVSITSGEFQNGTIKMVATRPYTRRKLISGKHLACYQFMGIFLLFASIASLAIGIAMNGFTFTSHILVFNADTVLTLPDFVVFLIYLASLALNIIFYISIAFLLSTIFRSSTFALFATFLIYFFGVLFNAIASASSWLIYTPFAHLDLFKYLGNASASNGFLAMNITTGANFVVSTLVLLGIIFAVQTATKIIFNKRDIA